jgi:hypothetical protein
MAARKDKIISDHLPGHCQLTNSNQSDEYNNDSQEYHTIFYDLKKGVKRSYAVIISISKKLTIQRLCVFCLIEYNGARICFEGRNQTVFKNSNKSSGMVTPQQGNTHIEA